MSMVTLPIRTPRQSFARARRDSAQAVLLGHPGDRRAERPLERVGIVRRHDGDAIFFVDQLLQIFAARTIARDQAQPAGERLRLHQRQAVLPRWSGAYQSMVHSQTLPIMSCKP